jgi:hypothetical protein
MLPDTARKDCRRLVPKPATLLAVPLACILFFPLYLFLYQFPAFNRLLKETALQQATTAAQLLAASLFDEEQVLQPGLLHPDLLRRIELVERQGQVLRLRVYSTSGEVAYSTEAPEIGTINRDPYFQEILIWHKVAAEQAGRGSPSLEGQHYPDEIIEAYVPIVRQGRLLGVLEIYYSAASQNQKRRSLFVFSTMLLTFAAAALLTALGIIASGLRQRLRELHAGSSWAGTLP